MNLYLLPGNSPKNRQWIEHVADSLKSAFDRIKIQYYDHWETDRGFVNFDAELKKFEQSVRDDNSYAVLGKSVGSLILLQALYEHSASPEKCIFVGTAVGLARRREYPIDKWLKSLPVPSLFVQQTGDPATSFTDLSNLLAELKVDNYEAVEVSGNDHAYQDIELLAHICEKFIKKL